MLLLQLIKKYISLTHLSMAGFVSFQSKAGQKNNSNKAAASAATTTTTTTKSNKQRNKQTNKEESRYRTAEQAKTTEAYSVNIGRFVVCD